MQAFSKIKLNGHILSAENGNLLLDGTPVNLKIVEVKNIDEGIFATKEELKEFYPISNPKKFIERDSGVYYPRDNPEKFISECDLNKYATKNDFEDFKKEALEKFDEKTSVYVKEYLDLLLTGFKKSKKQEELSKEFSIFDQVEAVLEASMGKNEKLNRIKEKLKKIES